MSDKAKAHVAALVIAAAINEFLKLEHLEAPAVAVHMAAQALAHTLFPE
jgi:hypothetical protein